jgi:nucleoid DNA-binding protein
MLIDASAAFHWISDESGASFGDPNSHERTWMPSTTSKKLTRHALLRAVAGAVGGETTPRQVGAVLDALIEVGHGELKKNGIFVLPGFAKFVVRKRPARPARKGINPFTKEPTIFAAKPASKTVRARPVIAIKEAIR